MIRWATLAAVLAALAGIAAALGNRAAGWAGAALAALGAALAVRAEKAARSEIAAIEAEAARASLEAGRQRAALDEFADGLDVLVLLCHADGTVEYANQKAVSTFRFDDPEGQNVLAVTLSHTLADLVAQVAASGEATRQEVSFSHPGQMVAEVQAWPIQDGGRIFLSLYDITDLRRLETVRRDFVANVSHEVRTPLANVRISAESALDSLDDAGLVEKGCRRIITEVDRLVRITDDLLTLSRVEANRGEREPVDLGKVVKAVVASFQARAAAKGVGLVVEAEGETDVFGDAGQLAQVVTNLVENAVSYTPAGVITVRVFSQGRDAVVEVKDTGIGIASEHLPRIFERFYRADKARSRETGGTGLGLSIVRNIVEAHGGSVQAESELNRGSVFTVRLPRLTD